MLKQTEIDRCGITVTRNMLRLKLKRHEAYFYEIRSKCDNFLEIRDTLESYNLETKGYRYKSFKDLRKIRSNYIERLKSKDNYHFVIILRRLLFGLLLHDPSTGLRYISKRKFRKMTTGEILVSKGKDFKKIKKFNILSNTEKSLLYVLSFVEFLTLASMISLKFIKYQFIFSFLFLAALFILFILHKSYLLHLSKKIDLNIIYPYIETEKDEKDYLEINKFKVQYLKNLNDKITAIFLLLSLLIYACFLDLKTILFLLVLSVLLGVIYLSFLSVKNVKSFEIYKEENDFLMSEKMTLETYENLVSKSTSYTKLIASFKSLVYLLIFTCFSIYYREEFNILNVIFNTVFYSYVVNTFCSLASSFKTNNDGLSKIPQLSSKIYRILVDN